jgi:hypothetical protein
LLASTICLVSRSRGSYVRKESSCRPCGSVRSMLLYQVSIVVLYGISIGMLMFALSAGKVSDVVGPLLALFSIQDSSFCCWLQRSTSTSHLVVSEIHLAHHPFPFSLYSVKWHPVVGVILWMSLPLAICSLLHYPLHNPLREYLPILPSERALDQQHTHLAYFCAAEAILCVTSQPYSTLNSRIADYTSSPLCHLA